MIIRRGATSRVLGPRPDRLDNEACSARAAYPVESAWREAGIFTLPLKKAFLHDACVGIFPEWLALFGFLGGMPRVCFQSDFLCWSLGFITRTPSYKRDQVWARPIAIFYLRSGRRPLVEGRKGLLLKGLSLE